MVKKVQEKFCEPYKGWTIHELEAELQKVRKEDPKDGKMRSAALQLMIRQRLEYVKGLAAKFEETNDRHVLVFDSSNGYSKIIGNSLIFYVQALCERLDRTCRVRTDTDDYFRCEHGVVSVRFNDALVTQFDRENVYQDIELSTDELHFFRLPSPYKAEDIERLTQAFINDQHPGAQKALNAHVLPKTTRKMAQLADLTAHTCRKVEDRFLRETVAAPLMTEMQETSSAMLDYVLRSGKPELSLWSLMLALQAMRKMRNRLVMVDYLNLFPRHKYALISDLSAQILEELEKEWRKMSQRDKALAAKIALEGRRRA